MEAKFSLKAADYFEDAGRYVPYISAAMLDQKNETYFNLSGKWTCIQERTVTLLTY